MLLRSLLKHDIYHNIKEKDKDSLLKKSVNYIFFNKD